MNYRRRSICTALAAAIILCTSAGAWAVERVAVVAPKALSDGFTPALTELKWKVAAYGDTAQDWSDLAKKLGDYDIVLASPGMKNASAELPKALLGFMNAGGAVVVTGVDAPESVAWLTTLDPKYEVQVKTPEKPKKAPDAEIRPDANNTVLSYPSSVTAAEAVASHFAFTGNNSREWGSAGRRAADNQPCVIVKRFGKGALILSTAQFRDTAFLGNVSKLLELQRMGVAFVSVSNIFGDEKTFSFGRGTTRIALDNTSGAAITMRATMSVAGKQASRTFWGEGMKDKDGRFNIDIPVMMDVRGPSEIAITLANKASGAHSALTSFAASTPNFLEIDPPTYRGMISTARRDAAVHFDVQLNPVPGDDVDGEVIHISAAGPDGKVIAEKETTVNGAMRIPLSLPLPADAAAGTYTLAAKMIRDGVIAESASAIFKIVPVRPGQMFVDQDGILLNEGKPFFPLGLYHVAGNEIEAAAKTGINMIQFWNWDAKTENLATVKKAGLKIIYEGQAWGQVINNHAKHPEHYDFEINPDYRADVERVRDDSSQTLGMWYTADEPSYSMLPGIKHIRDYWHALDEEHPTYIVSTGDPRIGEGADVLGVDVYPVYQGRHRELTIVGDAMDTARSGVRYRKPVIAVLQAFGNNERHHEKPEEVRCMSYIAMTHGVHGIFWYCWKETGDKTGAEGAGYHPATIKVLTDVIAEAKAFAPALLEPNNRMLKSEDGRIHAIVAGSKATGQFLIYVNTGYELADSTLDVPELAGATLEPLNGGPAGAVAKGQLKLKLPPLATGAFRITGEK